MSLNPFTMCLKCHKTVLITKLTTYKGKVMCNDCKARMQAEERENVRKGKGN